jgi:hypothetical protein
MTQRVKSYDSLGREFPYMSEQRKFHEREPTPVVSATPLDTAVLRGLVSF